MRLSKREIVLLYVLIICLIVFVGVTFIITPMTNSISDGKTNLEQKESEYRERVYEYNRNNDLPSAIEREQEILAANKDSINKYYSDTALYKFTTKCFKDAEFSLTSYISSPPKNVNDMADVLMTSINVELAKSYADKAELEPQLRDLLISMYDYMNSVVINSAKYSIRASGNNFDCSIIVNFSIYMIKS